MKSLKVIAVAVMVAIVGVVPASARRVTFGPRVGVSVSSLKFNGDDIIKETFNKDNMAGFTAGLTAEIALIAGLNLDASVMYVDRGTYEYTYDNGVDGIDTYKQKQQYIEIPINLKYKISLPVVSKFLAPYIFTGPSFAFNCSTSALKDAVDNKTVDTAWNFGIGLQLIKKLQISASYGLPLSNSLKRTFYGELGMNNTTVYDGKNHVWTITAAWLF